VNHIQLKQTLVGLQRSLWERLRERAATETDAATTGALAAAAESLRTDLKSLEELYNVYAQVCASTSARVGALSSLTRPSCLRALSPLRSPTTRLLPPRSSHLRCLLSQVWQLWDVCLRLLDFSAYAAADADQLMLSLWDRYLHPAHQPAVAAAAGPRPSAAAVLEEAARRAATTGAALYPGELAG
jgi:hypothetical protein